MGSESTHLSVEQVQGYLDGELSGVEYADAAAHLAACAECRAEVAAVRRLFLALDELVPAPDLVPAVRARLASERPVTVWQWLAPALQAAAVVALLLWAATRPPAYWPGAAETLRSTLQSWWDGLASWAAGLAAGLPRWLVELPGALSAWPGAAWGAVQGWAAHLSAWSGPALSPDFMVVLVAVLVVVGLVGNLVLLRRAALNGHAAR
jgi:hypothetical protein